MKEKSILVIFIAFAFFFIKPISNCLYTNMKPESVYLNKQIQKFFEKYPEITGDDLKLAKVFNEKRKTMSDAEIRDGDAPNEERLQDKAQAAIDDFKEFARGYTKIADKLEDAVEDLNNTEEDSNVPIEIKYEADTLLYKLKKSETLKDAEKALQSYVDFKKKLQNYGKDTTPSQQTTFNSPPTKFLSSSGALTEENIKDLKEIINIFNKLVRKNSPEMDDLTDEVLTKPKALKKLSKALRQLSEKDCYDDNIISGLRLYFF